MIVLSMEEFAAKRRQAQADIEEALYDVVAAGVDLDVDTGGWDEVLDAVEDQYLVQYREEGEGDPPPLPSGWRDDLRETLRKTTSPRTETTVNRISTWLATWVLSQATIAATIADTEDLLLEWVDMGDGDVRPSHAETAGQQRPVGEPFDVGGVDMPYPGWPGAPIELWINCRCTIRPVMADEFVQALVVAMTQKIDGVGQTESDALTAGGAGMDPKDEINEVAPEDVKAPLEDVVVQWHGVLAPESKWSGDRRQFASNSLTMRPAPLPLTWQRASADGHGGSVTVAKITQIFRVGDEMRAHGTFIVNAEADEVVALLADFGRFGVSVDADDVEFELNEEEEGVVFTKARIASASIVAIPAFAEAWVALGPAPEDFFENGEELATGGEQVDDEALVAANAFVDVAPGITEDGPGWLTHPVDTDRLRDYWVRGPGAAEIAWGTPGDFNRCRMAVAEYVKPQHLSGYCANRHYDALGFWPGEHHSIEVTDQDMAPAVSLVASNASAIKAPAGWFKNPEFTEKTHLTITEEGQVFGHIATWDTCHGKFSDQCVLPPRSATNYAYFATGQVLTDEGPVNTGPITVGGAHAHGRKRLRPAMAHYENTTAAVCDVAIGEDSIGIWVAGWVRPGATDEQVTALRASDVSGDWRAAPGGSMELIAALAVNSGGFHTPRVAAAIEDGRQISLVAAGYLPMEMAVQDDENLARFGEIIATHVAKELQARVERKKHMQALAARVNGD